MGKKKKIVIFSLIAVFSIILLAGAITKRLPIKGMEAEAAMGRSYINNNGVLCTVTLRYNWTYFEWGEWHSCGGKGFWVMG